MYLSFAYVWRWSLRTANGMESGRQTEYERLEQYNSVLYWSLRGYLMTFPSQTCVIHSRRSENETWWILYFVISRLCVREWWRMKQKMHDIQFLLFLPCVLHVFYFSYSWYSVLSPFIYPYQNIVTEFSKTTGPNWKKRNNGITPKKLRKLYPSLKSDLGFKI